MWTLITSLEVMMTHDYLHCFDFKDDCPEDCFRAKLARDLVNQEGRGKTLLLSFAHYLGTDEYKKGEKI